MNKRTLYIWIIFFVISCTSNEVKRGHNNASGINKTDTTIEEDDMEPVNAVDYTSFKIGQWKDSFIYNTKISCFNEDSISNFESIAWNDYNSYLNYATPVIGALAQQIEGIEKLEPWHMSINDGTKFLYSIQNRNNHIGITLIGGNDAWVTEIRYLAFDLQGKQLGNVVLASKGGDGGYHTTGHGCFINDSTYKYEFIETEYNSETEVEELYDSGELTYLIHSTGNIETKKKR